MAPKVGVKKSPAWTYFENQGEWNICLLCKIRVKRFNNTSNMLNHLKLKHPFEYQDMMTAPGEEKPKHLVTSVSDSSIQSSPAETLDRTVTYKNGSSRKTLLDRDLLLLIVQDLQPLSIVEDKGFRQFISDLDPKYQLPCRREIASNLLPTLYEETKSQLFRELCDANAIALTTDLWSSRHTQSFMTVTAHFINKEWVLKSCVLETPRLAASHTAQNISDELVRVMSEWQIQRKVVAVVTDNSSKETSAVNKLGLTQIPCFAHTINLVVNGAIQAAKSVEKVKKKVRSIVTHFHCSAESTEKLEGLQLKEGKPLRHLIQEIDTRWTSTSIL